MQLLTFRRFSLSPAECALPSAMVTFPTSDSAPAQAFHPSTESTVVPPPYLPFRRISLSSAPNLQHRISVVSSASFDSVPEGNEQHPSLSASPSKANMRGVRPRYTSIEAARRNHRRREVKSVVIDEQREAKRRKVIHELHETERTYVEGLELIYSVRSMYLPGVHFTHVPRSIS